jgi:hypothetical protein
MVGVTLVIQWGDHRGKRPPFPRNSAQNDEIIALTLILEYEKEGTTYIFTLQICLVSDSCSLCNLERGLLNTTTNKIKHKMICRLLQTVI